MRRSKQITYRQVASSDESDVESTDRDQRANEDALAQLTMADLGNYARDRLTAHDLESDRDINFAQLNKDRKCNQKGTEEAINAMTNQKQITGWTTFGGTDSTTTLDNIASGQYHRDATSRKVQAEVEFLRKANKKINAESVDNGKRQILQPQAVGTIGRNRVRKRQKAAGKTAVSCLDPALDMTQPHNGKAPICDTQMPTKKNGKPSRLRRVQERPWPPAALVENSKPLATSNTGPTPSGVSSSSSFVDMTVQSVNLQSHRVAGRPFLNLADSFDVWYTATAPVVTEIGKVSPEPIAHAKASMFEIEATPIRINRLELDRRAGVTQFEIPDDFGTQGRLTPVTMSDTTSQNEQIDHKEVSLEESNENETRPPTDVPVSHVDSVVKAGITTADQERLELLAGPKTKRPLRLELQVNVASSVRRVNPFMVPAISTGATLRSYSTRSEASDKTTTPISHHSTCPLLEESLKINTNIDKNIVDPKAKARVPTSTISHDSQTKSMSPAQVIPLPLQLKSCNTLVSNGDVEREKAVAPEPESVNSKPAHSPPTSETNAKTTTTTTTTTTTDLLPWLGDESNLRNLGSRRARNNNQSSSRSSLAQSRFAPKALPEAPVQPKKNTATTGSYALHTIKATTPGLAWLLEDLKQDDVEI